MLNKKKPNLSWRMKTTAIFQLRDVTSTTPSYGSVLDDFIKSADDNGYPDIEPRSPSGNQKNLDLATRPVDKTPWGDGWRKTRSRVVQISKNNIAI